MTNNIFEPGGYPIDLENKLELSQLRDDSAVLSLVGSYKEVKFDPRVVLKIENQRSQSSCAGHSLSSVVEWCHLLASGQTGMQLSRAMGYYEAQRLDNIRGDKGSTISAGVKLTQTTGLCEEKLWPYPSRYDPSRPRNWSDIEANAANYKIGSATRITSYDGFRAFLGSGQGGIHIGIAWSSNVMSKAVVERYQAGGGGHAICGLTLSERLDKDGKPFAWIMNSWSESFGNKGWSEWSPTAIQQMLNNSRTSMVGLSDMPNVKPRELTRQDWIDGLIV